LLTSFCHDTGTLVSNDADLRARAGGGTSVVFPGIFPVSPCAVRLHVSTVWLTFCFLAQRRTHDITFRRAHGTFGSEFVTAGVAYLASIHGCRATGVAGSGRNQLQLSLLPSVSSEFTSQKATGNLR
jgi:hypothetical protein